MALRFAELMFTPHVKAEQEKAGSRQSYARMERPEAPARDRLGPGEADFIAARDSFYMASVSETGWPYVQHRGGPPGFLKLLDERRIGFADFRGNRQYVSVGNLKTDDRVALFLMDYPNQRRLKLLGHAREVTQDAEPELVARLRDPAYGAVVERGIVIAIEGFDWNCPQHITPRFTEAGVQTAVAPLMERLKAAEDERDRLAARLAELEARP
jgi:predicted pyridoxine 5'-phosphate oxidase superfamily flavin-nucleotide-binding protein